MRKWFEMRAGAGTGAAEISIYGAIGKSFFDDDSVGASDFANSIRSLGDVSEITLRINSPGGDVFDGVAIHNLLKHHPAKVTAHVDGLAASAASLIAMAADEIVMPANAFMLVHEPSGGAWGTADTMMAMAADLERMTETFAATYAQRSGMGIDAVKALMKDDRLIDAAEAREMGLCDRLADPVKMAASYSLVMLPAHARTVMEAAITAGGADDGSVDDGSSDDADARSADVVNIDTARASARDGAFAEAAEIAELCGLAGLPQMAAEFIAKRSTVSSVRAALVEAKAKKDEHAMIVAAHADAAKADARGAWDRVINNLNS